MKATGRSPSRNAREWVPRRRCPCGGRFYHDVQPFTQRGVFFGHYVFWTCEKCAETVVPPETSEMLDEVAKAKGVWGAASGQESHGVLHHRELKAHA